MSVQIKKSNNLIFGVLKIENGFHVGANLKHLRKAGINLYRKDTKKLFKSFSFADDLKTGDMFCLDIFGIDTDNLMYRLFADEKEFVDEYARIIYGNETYGKKTGKDDLFGGFASLKTAGTKPLMIPYSDSLIYLVHPRGFTMADSLVRTGKGTFLGIIKKIPYLKSINVTAVELMPVNEFIEALDLGSLSDKEKALHYKDCPDDEKKVNYWGFDYSYHFAIKESYAYENADEEFSKMVSALHDNGIECILQMYYKDGYSDEYIMDSLINMVVRYGVDGFRLLGDNLPIMSIVNNPFLQDTKILLDCDMGFINNNTPVKYKNLCYFNDRYMNMARKILKSDEDLVSYISYSLRENHKHYAVARYITDYYGFNLKDLVSYNKKHNELNLENNEDGSSYNYSWNCGEEGESRKRNIVSLRKRQARNAMMLVMTAQGVPVVKSGDEFLDTQLGNNNPYCQDNEIGWVNWKNKTGNKDFWDFFKNLSAFRKRHSILHQHGELMLNDYIACKMPDVSFHSEEAFKINCDNDSREFAILYAGAYAKQYTGKEEPSVMFVYNFHWEDRKFCLPYNTKGKTWSLLYSTDGSTDESFDEKNAQKLDGNEFIAQGRSVSVLLLT